MKNKEYAYNILSKIQADNFAVGKLFQNTSAVFYDHNESASSFLYWRNDYHNDTTEIIKTNNINAIVIKDNTGRMYSNNIFSSNFKTTNFQVEFELSIPNIKSNNIYFTFYINNNQLIKFDIQLNALSISCNNKTIKAGFKFKSNIKYNLLVTKENNLYSFMVDGIYIGYIDSPDFTNNINVTGSSAAGIIGNSHPSDIKDDSFIGYIYNINISDGQYLKYYTQYSKYATNLISYLNINSLSFENNANTIVTNIEAIPAAKIWEYNNLTVESSYITNTLFTANINTNFTLLFVMNNNNKNLSSIELININDIYKVIYTSVYITPEIVGIPEPDVILNDNTTAALNFENGLVDQIGTTVWTKEGTADITSVNKIFGKNSFETKSLGDSLSTTSKLITGGATPFTIEFNALIKGGFGYNNRSFPLLSKDNNSGDGDQYMAVDGDIGGKLFFYRGANGGGFWGDGQRVGLGKQNINFNDINKYTITYDGSALRCFINNKLDIVIGSIQGFRWENSESFKFLRSIVPSWSQYSRSTCGIIDNINIHDGIATRVRDPDPHEEFLVVDLAFDGENNSTKIVDNGTAKLTWTTNGTAKLSTDQKFDGFSSLKISDLTAYIKSDNNILNFNTDDSYTIKFDFIINNDTYYHIFLANYASSQEDISMIFYNPATKSISIRALNSVESIDQFQLTKIISPNILYNFTMVYDKGSYSFYINNQLNLNVTSIKKFDFTKSGTIIGQYYSSTATIFLDGYIKNFKIYKGAAVIPENPTGKIQLDFDNNVIDKYGNSTWTNNSGTFDQVNSVKGHALKLAGNATVTSTSSDLNFANKGFDLSYDVKVSDISSGSRYAITNNTSYTSAGSIWLAASSYLGFDYFSKPTDASSSNINGIIANTYYSQSINRRKNNIFIKYNDVICNVHNLTNQQFNFISGGNIAFGRASSFGVGDSINGFIDNFKSVKEIPDVINDGTEGIWIQAIADCNSADMPKYDFNNTASSTYKEYYNNTISFAALNYKRGSGSVTISSPIIINKSVLNKSFNIFAQNGCWHNSQINVTMEILDSANNVIAALKWNRVNTFSHFMYFGQNLSNLTQAPYKGSYPGTFGTLHFKEDKVEFEHNDSYSDTNKSFVFNVNLTDAKSIRVANLYAEEDYGGCRSFFVLTKLPIEKGTNNLDELIIDRPAVHLPLETNAVNIGFSNLTINSVGNPTYTTIDGKKCIKFESGKYLTINSNNIFNLGNSSDFYIEFDVFIPLMHSGTNGHGIFGNNTNWDAIDSNRIEIISLGSLRRIKSVALINRDSTNIQTVLESDGTIIENTWNNVIISRRGSIISISVNGTVSTFQNLLNIDYSKNGLHFGQANNANGNTLDGYMSNFKMFVGTSEIPETYNDKKVLDLDFKPTGKSYLFKDNNNKCIIHPVNITQRDYQKSKYCVSFNGTNQYLKLEKNNLLNFENDDFIIEIEFSVNSFNNIHQRLIADGEVSPALNYMMITGDQYSLVESRNCIFFGIQDSGAHYMFSKTKVLLDTLYNVKITRTGTEFRMYVNDVLDNSFIDPLPCNFNKNNITVIGASGGAVTGVANQAQYFDGHIYSIKILRNTSDISLLQSGPPIEPDIHMQKYELTNGINTYELEYDDNIDKSIKLINDDNTITLSVNDDVISINKNNNILGNNVKLFNDYTGHIKDHIKLYNKAIYENDSVISDFIDTAIPPIEIEDTEIEVNDINIGAYNITGYIEGNPNAICNIVHKPLGYIIASGVGQYNYDNIDYNYIDEYEIQIMQNDKVINRYDIVNMGPPGSIKVFINSKVCTSSNFVIRAYRRDSGVFIGEYELDKTRDPYECKVHNLDTTKTYDIMLFDKNNNVESRVMSNRSPEAY